MSAAPVVAAGSVKFGNDLPISIIAGPCQLESRAHALEVADIAQAEALFRQSGIASQRQVGRLIIPPDVAHGATLIFETA